MARRGTAGQGQAWLPQGTARQGGAWRGKAWLPLGMAGLDRAGLPRGKARHGQARQGQARQGVARQGFLKARLGKARPGKAGRGQAWQAANRRTSLWSAGSLYRQQKTVAPPAHWCYSVAMTSTAATTADVRLVAYITADERARLTVKARDSRRSVSSYVRDLIADDLNQEEQP